MKKIKKKILIIEILITHREINNFEILTR